jgi:hypothetical protein
MYQNLCSVINVIDSANERDQILTLFKIQCALKA